MMFNSMELSTHILQILAHAIHLGQKLQIFLFIHLSIYSFIHLYLFITRQLRLTQDSTYIGLGVLALVLAL